jgi:hypothetical protein
MVRITDFYGGYDAVACRQQKCLVHLIRDLNDDLWNNPFNQEFESFVGSVRNLLVPILEDVEKFGLWKRHLHKHQKAIQRFYRLEIDALRSSSELVAKYQKRFVRYRDSLFAFLDNDGVSWNNNEAERAIRHLAIQRKISGFFSGPGCEKYLVLLGVAQTCRFQGKSFLKFLLSGEKNVDNYRERKTRKR